MGKIVPVRFLQQIFIAKWGNLREKYYNLNNPRKKREDFTHQTTILHRDSVWGEKT
jgi:hypothetical protein